MNNMDTTVEDSCPTIPLQNCNYEEIYGRLNLGETNILQRLDPQTLSGFSNYVRHHLTALLMKHRDNGIKPDPSIDNAKLIADLDNALKTSSLLDTVSPSSFYTYTLPHPVTSNKEVPNSDSNVSVSGKRQREEDEFIVVQKRHTFKQKNSQKSTSQGKNTPQIPVSKKTTNTQNSSVQQQAPVTQPKIKIPPFFIKPPTNWDLLLLELKRSAPTARASTHRNFVRVQCTTELEYRAVQSLLTAKKVEFKSYLLENDKHVKIVIRGLPINTPLDRLKNEIDLYDVPGLTITQLYRGPSTKRALLPLFLLDFPRIPFSKDRVLEIKNLMGLEVTLENFRGRKGPTQCHNCQGFFHSAAACHLQPRCVKCAERHSTSTCQKPFEEPCRCANCDGAHPANYRACPKFPKAPQKTFKNSTKSGKPNSTFSSMPTRKVNAALSFAKVATGQSAQASPPPAPKESTSKSNSAPQIGAFSAAEFMNQILVFEKSYSRQLIARAFRDNLFLIQAAPSDMEKICILYEGLVKLSS